MRVLFLFLQLLIISLHPAFAKNTNPTPPEWTIKRQKQVLRISNTNTAGTGFLIKDTHRTLLVTNAHIVSSLLKGYGTLPPNMQMIGLDLRYDLVVIKINGKFEEGKTLTLADTDIEASSKLRAIGFPEGILSTISGQLLPYDYFPNIKFMMSNFYNLSGASGSPVLNSEEQVIGILHSGINNWIAFSSVAVLKNILFQPPLTCKWRECFNNELNHLQQLAETDPLAQYQLGMLYLAKEISGNLIQTLQLFLLAAEQGFAPAQYQLNRIIQGKIGIIPMIFKKLRKVFPGIEMPQIFTKADESLLVAAEQGFAPAQYTLGILYLNGIGVEQDLTKAIYWIKQAAEQGFAPAQYQLGILYLNGIGVEQDIQQAQMWLWDASEKQHPLANEALLKTYKEKEDG